MLRLHLTHDDLARIRFAPAPLPLWETSFSVRLLQRSDVPARFELRVVLPLQRRCDDRP
jgi:hypothetical protein